MSVNMMRSRQNSRMRDIAESQNLLLELMTTEPTVLQCFNIIESTCLSQGLVCHIQGQDVSDGFHRFLDRHYIPFCKGAIRAMYTYGFVPWRLRRVQSGDEVPEVLPPGTFSWHTETGYDERDQHGSRQAPGAKRKRPPSNDDTRLVVYRITPSSPGLHEEDVHVYTSQMPGLDITVNSGLYATVVSPMSYLLTDYKNLREAQKRRSHADAWNTTARIVSTFRPTLRVEDNPTQYLMDFVHEKHFAPPAMGNSIFPPFEAHNVWQREQVMRRQFMETPSNHHPEVYALPRDHDVVQQGNLVPCEDLSFLLDKYRRDVSALMGIPHEMIIGRDTGNHETVRKTVASGRIFSTNMHEICRHLSFLLCEVYSSIYGEPEENVEFFLVPMPRLEIETIQDFKILHEIGALTPDFTVRLSRILLGEDHAQTEGARRREAAKNERKAQGIADAGQAGFGQAVPGGGSADASGLGQPVRAGGRGQAGGRAQGGGQGGGQQGGGRGGQEPSRDRSGKQARK